MKKLIITALTFSALLALTNPVNAEGFKVGDVFYCESEVGAFAEESSGFELKKWISQKFRLKIENEKLIKFGSVDWLAETNFKMDFLSDLDMLAADNGFGSLYVIDERFNLSQSNFAGVYMMTGTCDKF